MTLEPQICGWGCCRLSWWRRSSWWLDRFMAWSKYWENLMWFLFFSHHVISVRGQMRGVISVSCWCVRSQLQSGQRLVKLRRDQKSCRPTFRVFNSKILCLHESHSEWGHCYFISSVFAALVCACILNNINNFTDMKTKRVQCSSFHSLRREQHPLLVEQITCEP